MRAGAVWVLMKRMACSAGIALVLVACGALTDASQPVPPPENVDPVGVMMNVTCGGPAFPIERLAAPANAEQDAHPAAAELRRLVGSPEATDLLPRTGWRLVAEEEARMVFVADAPPGSEPPLVEATVERVGGSWQATGFGQCWPMPDVGPGLGLAEFRVAPHVGLSADLVEIDVLVTERACNSGEDARGRIVAPAIIPGPDTMFVVFAVVPRPGGHDCPSNPETPFRLVLPEPLGERTLLDGSSIPPRDATTCPDISACQAPAGRMGG